MIPIQHFASFLYILENSPCKWFLVFLLDVRISEDFSASLGLIWSCMDNFESIASPGLARPLHICDAV